MNKKGFTLVELIGVLVLIGVLFVMALTPILGQLRNNGTKLDAAATKILYSSTSNYLDDFKNLYPKNEGATYYITIAELLNNNSLSSDFLKSYTQSTLSRSDVVKVSVSDGGFHYSLASASDNLNTISYIYNNMSKNSTYMFMGGTYIKGATSSNYIYYSGLMWRIMGINKDGSIRLIADAPVTTLYYGDSSTYSTSYVKTWLNDYFVSRLKYSDIIENGRWCSLGTATSSTATDLCSSLAESSFSNEKVGLLSLYEYNMSLSTSVSYLINGSNYLLGTNDLSNNLYSVSSTGIVSSSGYANLYYVTPVINVIPEAIVTTGAGTAANPYILEKNNTPVSSSSTKNLNTVNLASGEYVSMSSTIYRVVNNDDSTVKLILNGVSTSTQVFNSSSTYSNNYNLTSGLANYLNNTYYNSIYSTNTLIKSTNWYQGASLATSTSYKLSSLSKDNFIEAVKVGIPKVGELMTSPIYGLASTNEFWTMSKPDDTTNLYTISNTKIEASSYTSSFYYRPVIIIDASANVTGGNGTITSPYTIQ